ncbi:MAG: ATP-binding cassette domain-containing protein [Parvibaculales bacterium]
MTSPPLISADNISLNGTHQKILDGVSLELAQGDFVTLIGPNGAGKSMLLKCLLGLIRPDSGHVERQADLRIGYMPQSLSIDPVLPISVTYFLTMAGQNTEAEIAEIVQETDIKTLLNRQLHDLSGGELQRVLLARALLNQPQILILDEPAQNLDVTGQLAFYKNLEKIYQKRSITILMVSHDLHLVMSSSQRVICLYHHICCQGAPQAVTKDPEFTALFGQDMARMMAVYPHDHDHHHEHDHNHEHDQHSQSSKAKK